MSATDIKKLNSNHPCFGNANVLMTVDDFFETRISNMLKAENLYYIGQLIGVSEIGLRKIPNLGRISLNEIKEVVENLGLQLGIESLPHNCDTPDKLKEFYGVQEVSSLFMTVALPKEMVDGLQYDDVVEKIKKICQQAFAVAVKLEVLSPHPSTPIDVIRSVNPSIKSIQINTGKSTTSFLVPLTAPFHEAVIYKPAFLSQVAEKIGGECLYSLLAPELQG
jgi:hypothetical protein